MSDERNEKESADLEAAARVVEAYCRKHRIDTIAFANFGRVSVPHVMHPFGGTMTGVGLAETLRKATAKP